MVILVMFFSLKFAVLIHLMQPHKMVDELTASVQSCYQELLLKYDRETATKMCQINADIARLHQQAQSAGLGLHQIQSAAEPLLKFIGRKRRCSEANCLWFSVAVAISVLSAIICYDPTYRLACSLARLSFIKVRQGFVLLPGCLLCYVTNRSLFRC